MQAAQHFPYPDRPPVHDQHHAAAVLAGTAVQMYRNEHLQNLSPVQVILKLYDTAIRAARQRNMSLAQRTISELIIALDFDQGEMATSLYRLYDFCKRSLRTGDPEDAVTILQELRATWAEAFHL